MKNQDSFLKLRKIGLSIIFGILSAVLSKHGIETHLDEVIISIPWSPLLPIIVALVMGWRYGLIAGLAGGIYFPFILWPYSGWANLGDSLIYLGYFVLVGYLYNCTRLKKNTLWLFAAVASFAVIMYVYDDLIFNRLLAHNPPFWESQTLKILPREILMHFAISDSINIFLLTLLSDILLRINIVRKLFGIPAMSILRNNHIIFLATLSVFFLVWLTYVGLSIAFSTENYSIWDINSQIALFVLILGSIIASRIIFHFSETHYKILDKLNNSEEKFRTIFENLHDVFYTIDLKGTILEISPSIEFHSDYTRDDLLGACVYDLYADASKRDTFIKRMLQDKYVNDFELEFKQKSNELIYCSVNARLVFDDNGHPKKIEGILRNITQRKLTEEKIHLNEQRFRQAQEVAKIGTFEFDVKNRIYWGSDEAKRIFGFNMDSGNFSIEAIRGCYVDRKETSAILDDALKNKVSYNYEYDIFKIGTHERRTVNSIAEIIRDENGNPVKIIGLIADITERKRIEKELIMTKEKAEESDRLKSAFLANMSHEIRTPMNAILGFSDLLRDPDLSGESQMKFIDLIEKSGERMLNTIQGIVDISKIESGQMVVNIKKTNINDQVEFVYKLLKLDSEKKGIDLAFKNSLPNEDAIIKTDVEKLYGILTNLVKNAIKYTDEGSIEFGYTIKGNSIEFYVKDTGIGIPKERQNAIFERFIQADIADVEARQGAGLGLAISKAFVEMLGGEIWVESDEGKGSTFYFTIEYHPESEPKPVTND